MIIQGSSQTPTFLSTQFKMLTFRCAVLCLVITAFCETLRPHWGHHSSLDLFQLNSLNLVLTRFLWEWEDELCLNDCAKDSQPVWPMVIWSLLISKLGNHHSLLWSLCSYRLLFLVPSVLCAQNWKFSDVALEKSFTQLLNLLHRSCILNAFMS